MTGFVTTGLDSVGIRTDDAGYDVGETLSVRAFVGGKEMDRSGGLGAVEAVEGAPELIMWDAGSMDILGEDGMEYVIAPKSAAPDWTHAVEPDSEGRVSFRGLTPAAEYEIYARSKGSAEDGVKLSAVTNLEGIGLSYEGVLTAGTLVTAKPEPEAEGLTYQWYRVFPDGGYPETIYGATGRTYTATGAEAEQLLMNYASLGN